MFCSFNLLSRRGHDTRVDLWSLGCVVFEALVGAHPFRRPRGERSDRFALFERIRFGRPEYPSFLSVSVGVASGPESRGLRVFSFFFVSVMLHALVARRHICHKPSPLIAPTPVPPSLSGASAVSLERSSHGQSG